MDGLGGSMIRAEITVDVHHDTISLIITPVSPTLSLLCLRRHHESRQYFIEWLYKASTEYIMYYDGVIYKSYKYISLIY